MVFDNSPDGPPPSPSALQRAHANFPLILLVVAAVGVAAGMHLASAALAVIAAGHVVLAGLLLALRALRQRRPSRPAQG